MKSNRLAALLLPVALSASLSGCGSTGYESSQASADAMRAALASVDSLSGARQAAFDALNALLAEPLENLPARFEAFSAAVDGVIGAEEGMKSAVADMKSSARGRFDAMKAEEAEYKDASIQARAQQNRARAEEAFAAGAAAADEMIRTGEGFVSYLSDLRRLLSNDLNPTGVAGVADLARNGKAANGKLEQMVGPTRSALEKAAETLSSR